MVIYQATCFVSMGWMGCWLVGWMVGRVGGWLGLQMIECMSLVCCVDECLVWYEYTLPTLGVS